MEKKDAPMTSTPTTAAASVEGAQALASLEKVSLEVLAAEARPKTRKVAWSSEWTLPSRNSELPKTTQLKKNSSKAAESESQAGASQESRSPDHRGAKRLATAEYSGEWKYLTAVHSQPVEKLVEKFKGLEVGSKGQPTRSLLASECDDQRASANLCPEEALAPPMGHGQLLHAWSRQ